MTDETCAICMETYTARTRQKVTCPFCPAAACKGCQQRSILSSYEDPQCYSCKAGWSPDFLASNFPLSFRNDTLRKHRRKILFEREKSMLPAMQVFVEAKKNVARVNALYDEANAKYQGTLEHYNQLRRSRDDAFNHYNALRTKHSMGEELSDAEKKTKRHYKKIYMETHMAEKRWYESEVRPSFAASRLIHDELRRWQQMYATGEDTGGVAAREKRQFIMRCPADGCRGFLSQNYVCGVCEKKTCADCLELLPAEDSSGTKPEHTCKPDLVETAKAIKRETRPCPKCGARIFKLEGCDQMYCTMEGCGTAFSWITGQIVTGRIHNPHYYEWLRRNADKAGTEVPREPGDIPCGGVPAAWVFTRAVLRDRGVANFTAKLTTAEANRLLEIHRNVQEFEARLREYPATRPALVNKELNVAYLMNELTETEWQRQMELAEARFNRKREIGQILQTLVVAASELLQGIQTRLDGYRSGSVTESVEAIRWVRETAMPMLESLRVYTNDAYRGLAKAQHMAVPQIHENWQWIGVRALYRAGPKAKKGADDTESVPPPLIDEEPAALNEIV